MDNNLEIIKAVEYRHIEGNGYKTSPKWYKKTIYIAKKQIIKIEPRGDSVPRMVYNPDLPNLIRDADLPEPGCWEYQEFTGKDTTIVEVSYRPFFKTGHQTELFYTSKTFDILESFESFAERLGAIIL